MAKKPMTCTIDYETKDGTTWKATVLAYSLKEAVAFIKTRVPTFVRLNFTESGREVDAFHPDVTKDYLTENVVEEIEVPVEIIKEVEIIKTVEVPVEVTVEVPVGTSDTDDVTCAWCDKKFKTRKTLRTHCIKYHLKGE